MPRSTNPNFARLRRRSGADGYTLVELVTVMAVTAILAAITAVFLRLPLQIYVDVERRAVVSDAAETAFSLIRRDLQAALPNSIRVSAVGSVYYLEFLHARTGGRYRADAPSVPVPTSANTCPDADGDGFANDNVLRFGVVEACFTSLGAIARFETIVPGADFLVVYNLGAGFAGADAYASGAVSGGNKSLIVGVAEGANSEAVVRFEPVTLTLDAPARRFHIVSGPVTYVCDPIAGTLQRISGYPISAAQPRPPAGTGVLVAQGLTGCTFTYDQNVVNQTHGIVSLWLRFTDPKGGDSATHDLLQQVQVSNES